MQPWWNDKRDAEETFPSAYPTPLLALPTCEGAPRNLSARDTALFCMFLPSSWLFTTNTRVLELNEQLQSSIHSGQGVWRQVPLEFRWGHGLHWRILSLRLTDGTFQCAEDLTSTDHLYIFKPSVTLSCHEQVSAATKWIDKQWIWRKNSGCSPGWLSALLSAWELLLPLYYLQIRASWLLLEKLLFVWGY